MRNAYKILVWKSERKKLLGKPTCKWEDNINMDLTGIQYDGVLNLYRMGPQGSSPMVKAIRKHNAESIHLV
jgi:hypothetical protein